jgi:hypothetical protein
VNLIMLIFHRQAIAQVIDPGWLMGDHTLT